jgi:hypothetical protein
MPALHAGIKMASTHDPETSACRPAPVGRTLRFIFGASFVQSADAPGAVKDVAFPRTFRDIAELPAQTLAFG